VQLDGRTIQGDFYRRGFNGMEKDDEVKGGGNSYDFGARMYDSRVGRFLSLDAYASKFPNTSPYNFATNSPLYKIDPNGNWDVEVHAYSDRSKYGYAIAIVKDNDGNEVYRFKVRVEGSAGRDRLKKDSDTPTGVYDIPDKDMWISGGDRGAYGPYHRLALFAESGEIKKSGRNAIRIHGGRQEGEDNPILKKTHGCMRSFDDDIKKMKEITDNLETLDPTEKGGKLTLTDDLVEFNGEYILSSEIELPKDKKKSNLHLDSYVPIQSDATKVNNIIKKQDLILQKPNLSKEKKSIKKKKNE
jgi:RHS repeat-associated protein